MIRRLLAALAVVVVALCTSAPAFAWDIQWPWENPPPATAPAAGVERQSGIDTDRLVQCMTDPAQDGCQAELEASAQMLGDAYSFLESEYIAVISATEVVGNASAEPLAAGMWMIGPVIYAIWLAWMIGGVMLSPLADGGEALSKLRPQIIKSLFWMALVGALASAGPFDLLWNEVVAPVYLLAAGISGSLLAGVYAAIGAEAPGACATSAASVAEVGGCAVSVVGSVWDAALSITVIMWDQAGMLAFIDSMMILIFLLSMALFTFLSFLKLLDRALVLLFFCVLSPVLVWGIFCEKGRKLFFGYGAGFLLAAAVQFVVLSVMISIMTSLIVAELAQTALDGTGFLVGNASFLGIARVTFVSILGALSLGAVDKTTDKLVEPWLGQVGGGSITGALGKLGGMAAGVAMSRPAMEAAKRAMGGLK